jgi:HEAT repeat protein
MFERHSIAARFFVAAIVVVVSSSSALGQYRSYSGPEGGGAGRPCGPPAGSLRGQSALPGVPRGATVKACGSPRRDADRTEYENWTYWWEAERQVHLVPRLLEARRAPYDPSHGVADPFAGTTETFAERRRAVLFAALESGLSDPSFRARAAAAVAFGRTADGGERDDARAARLLRVFRERVRDEGPRARPNDDRYEVFETAAIGLALLRRREAAPDLLDAVNPVDPTRRPKDRVRATSAIALGLLARGDASILDEAAVERLLSPLDEPTESDDLSIAIAASASIARLKAAAPRLLKLSSSLSATRNVRAHATLALAQVDPRGAIPFLLAKASRDGDASVRAAAYAALGRAALRTDEAVAAHLIAALSKEPTRSARLAAAFALGRIGNEVGLAALAAIVDDEGEDARAIAALALGVGVATTGAENKSAFGDVVAAAFDRTRDAHEKAAFALALGLIDTKAGFDRVSNALKVEKLASSRAYFAEALALFRSHRPGPEALAAVRALARQKRDLDAARRAFPAAAIYGDADDLLGLVSILRERDNNFTYVGDAAQVLGLIGDARVFAELTEMARPSEDVFHETTRAFALVALGFDGAGEPTLPASPLRAHFFPAPPTWSLAELSLLY